jgi:hypothetical protein
MDRTPADMHMQNPPYYFCSEIYGRTKSEVPCGIERWENEDGRIATQKRRPPSNPSELRLSVQFEETPWCAVANALLPHGHANDLCQQRLGELAHLGMLADGGGERTTEASDDDFIIRVLQLGQTTEILQDANCDFQTLTKLSLCRDLGKRSPNAGGKTPANLAQQLRFLCRSDAGFQRMEKLIEEQIISLGKKLSGFRRERVEGLRFARGRPLTRLPDKPIAFQGRKMRADCVVSQTQRLGQLVDGSLPSAQQFYDLSARAGEKAITPTFHNLKKYIQAGIKQYNQIII